MALDNFVENFVKFRRDKGISVEEASSLMNISPDTLINIENGFVVPSIKFIEDAKAVFNIESEKTDFENTFTQSYFGFEIPFVTEADIINDCTDRVISYIRLPHLEHYGENNLFAVRYMGGDVAERGILHGSILVFVNCEKVTCDGVYAIVSRGTLQFKTAERKDGKITLRVMNGKKNMPKTFKSAKAIGRLVSCINIY